MTEVSIFFPHGVLLKLILRGKWLETSKGATWHAFQWFWQTQALTRYHHPKYVMHSLDSSIAVRAGNKTLLIVSTSKRLRHVSLQPTWSDTGRTSRIHGHPVWSCMNMHTFSLHFPHDKKNPRIRCFVHSGIPDLFWISCKAVPKSSLNKLGLA